jgi:hypothetical protein
MTLDYATPTTCKADMSNNGPFGDVTCVIHTNDLAPYYYLMTIEFTFLSWPIYPKENNLFSNDGNPSNLDLYCILSRTVPLTYCQFTSIESTNIRGFLKKKMLL